MSTLIIKNATVQQKINACLAEDQKAAMDFTKVRASALKPDGSIKFILMDWMLTTNRDKLQKVKSFSLSCKMGKNEKTYFLEVATITPNKKQGIVLSFRSSTIGHDQIKEAAEKFLDLEVAKSNVNQGNLPQEFYLMAYVFHASNLLASVSTHDTATIAELTDLAWKEGDQNLKIIFSQFYSIHPSQTIQTLPQAETRAIGDLSKLTEKELKQLCTDSEIPIVDTDKKADLMLKLSA